MKTVKVPVPENLSVDGFKIEQGNNSWQIQCKACRRRWGFPLDKQPGVGVKLSLLDHKASHESRGGRS